MLVPTPDSESGSVEKAGVEATVKEAPALSVDDQSLSPLALTPEEEQRLWRKIDLRLLPILIIMYLVGSIDRSNIGNAKLQGLLTQLGLTGDEYNVVLTVYFISYTLCTVPSNMVLKKFRPSKWLPGITLAWGIISTLMGLVKNYPQLLGVRLCLGIAEGGLAPGVFYYITMWYPRHMVQFRVGLFWGGATFAGAFSGLLAFATSRLSGRAGLLGWSWIFIIDGLITVVVAIFAFMILVDFPDTAAFLTPKERAYMVHLKRYENSSVGEEEHFELRQLWETIFDWKVILCCLINMSVITPVYGITLFLPSIINGFGFNAVVSQLLSVPPYVVATAAVVGLARWSDNIKKRSPSIFIGLLFCLVGFAINAADVSIGVKYFGTFLAVTGSYAGFPGNVSWMGNNTVGHYKRAIAIGMQVMFANAGGAISCNIYRANDAPRYLLGHAVLLGFVCMGLTILPVMVFTYTRANRQRDARQHEMKERGIKVEYTVEQLRKMGNEAPDFRYTL